MPNSRAEPWRPAGAPVVGGAHQVVGALDEPLDLPGITTGLPGIGRTGLPKGGYFDILFLGVTLLRLRKKLDEFFEFRIHFTPK
jgi:hypothetical protein